MGSSVKRREHHCEGRHITLIHRTIRGEAGRSSGLRGGISGLVRRRSDSGPYRVDGGFFAA